MYEFWYGYVKRKYVEKVKLYYMNTDRLIIYIKIEDIYNNITGDVEARFYIANYELERSSLDKKIKK